MDKRHSSTIKNNIETVIKPCRAIAEEALFGFLTTYQSDYPIVHNITCEFVHSCQMVRWYFFWFKSICLEYIIIYAQNEYFENWSIFRNKRVEVVNIKKKVAILFYTLTYQRMLPPFAKFVWEPQLYVALLYSVLQA